MGERKVLNKYYPPDFDVSLLKRFGQRNTGFDPFKQIEVRMMLPFSVQCVKCGEFSYRGKKFNSKKENVDEDYKGIKKVRFYMKCGVCSNIFSIKTDPKNADYEVEFGVTRNFESWMKAKEEDEREAAEDALDDKGDSMKALEKRTLSQKRESDIADGLDEMLALNKRNEIVDVDKLLAERHRKSKGKTEEEAAAALAKDEALAAEVFRNKKLEIKRLTDEDADGVAGGSSKKPNKWANAFAAAPAAGEGGSAKPTSSTSTLLGKRSFSEVSKPAPGVLVAATTRKIQKKSKKKKKKKKKDKNKKSDASNNAAAAPATGGGLDLGDYESSHSE